MCERTFMVICVFDWIFKGQLKTELVVYCGRGSIIFTAEVGRSFVKGK